MVKTKIRVLLSEFERIWKIWATFYSSEKISILQMSPNFSFPLFLGPTPNSCGRIIVMTMYDQLDYRKFLFLDRESSHLHLSTYISFLTRVNLWLLFMVLVSIGGSAWGYRVRMPLLCFWFIPRFLSFLYPQLKRPNSKWNYSQFSVMLTKCPNLYLLWCFSTSLTS